MKFRALTGKEWDLRLGMGTSGWIQKIEGPCLADVFSDVSLSDKTTLKNLETLRPGIKTDEAAALKEDTSCFQNPFPPHFTASKPRTRIRFGTSQEEKFQV